MPSRFATSQCPARIGTLVCNAWLNPCSISPGNCSGGISANSRLSARKTPRQLMLAAEISVSKVLTQRDLVAKGRGE
jgi:hypothetical protein